MDQEIALIESKTFWCMAAGFILQVAHAAGLATSGVDPNILGVHLWDIAIGALYVGGIVGRWVAKSKVTGVLKAANK